MATTLYMDKETRELLEHLKQREPDFNMAQFFKKHLGLEATGKSEDTENLIHTRIKEAELSIKTGEASLNFWKQKLESYYEEQKQRAIKRDKERKSEEEENGYKNYLEQVHTTLADYFENNGYKVYKEGIKEGKWKSTTEFYERYLKNNNS